MSPPAAGSSWWDRQRNYFPLLLLCLALALPPAPLTAQNPGEEGPPDGSTWSIVALDPQSGDVGVAGASCFPGAIDAIAALVPGRGAAATQAEFDLDNRNRVFQLLQEGRSAPEIVSAVTASSVDPGAARRQYGIVTLGEGAVQTAGFTGSETFPWAGHEQDQSAAVAVQGNILEGEAVVARALSTFVSPANVDPSLAERLMRGLEAGSEAGGDRRCNEGDARQTASAAFIMVAQGHQRPYTTEDLGITEAGEPNTPWLYVSVTEPIGGDNAVPALRRAYDAWRAESAATATTAQPTSAPAPTPTVPAPSPSGALPGDALLVAMAVFTALVMVAAILWARRRPRP